MGELVWARWPWHRCRARLERNETGHHGRCELVAGHEGPHALERGMVWLLWSSSWTVVGAYETEEPG